MMTMAEARLRSGIMGTWELMFASQWLDDFQGQKFEDRQKSLRYLKEMWREDEMKFIASMEKEVMESCQTMGLDSNTALMVERNREAKERSLARQTAESQCCDTLRFEEAMQKERAIREQREKEMRAAAVRRKLAVATIKMRSLIHSGSSIDNPNLQEPLGYPCESNNNKQLHAHEHVLEDRTNWPSSVAVNKAKQSLQAAKLPCMSTKSMRSKQLELNLTQSMKLIPRGHPSHKQRDTQLELEDTSQWRCSPKICSNAPYLASHTASQPSSCPGPGRSWESMSQKDSFAKKYMTNQSENLEHNGGQDCLAVSVHSAVEKSQSCNRMGKVKKRIVQEGLFSELPHQAWRQKLNFQSVACNSTKYRKHTSLERHSFDQIIGENLSLEMPLSQCEPAVPSLHLKTEVRHPMVLHQKNPSVDYAVDNKPPRGLKLQRTETSSIIQRSQVQPQSSIQAADGRRPKQPRRQRPANCGQTSAKKHTVSQRGKLRVVSQLFSSPVPSSAAYHNLVEEVRGPGMQSKKGSRFARQWSSCGVGTGGSLYAASTRAFSTSRKRKAKSPYMSSPYSGSMYQHRLQIAPSQSQLSFAECWDKASADDEIASIIDSVKGNIKEDVYRSHSSVSLSPPRARLVSSDTIKDCARGYKQGVEASRSCRSHDYFPIEALAPINHQKTSEYRVHCQTHSSASWREDANRWQGENMSSPQKSWDACTSKDSSSNCLNVKGTPFMDTLMSQGTGNTNPKTQKQMSIGFTKQVPDNRVRMKGMYRKEYTMEGTRFVRGRATWKQNDLNFNRKRVITLKRSHSVEDMVSSLFKRPESPMSTVSNITGRSMTKDWEPTSYTLSHEGFCFDKCRDNELVGPWTTPERVQRTPAIMKSLPAMGSETWERQTQQDRKSHVNAHLTNHTHSNKVTLTQRNQWQRHLGTLKVAYAGHLQSPPPHIRVAECTNHAQESQKVSVNMGQITARDLADKLIDGWVTGKYGVEFSNAMERATLLTGQQVTSKLVSEGCLQQQCTLGPWLSQIETPEIVSPCETHGGSLLPSAGACMTDCLHKQLHDQ
ncbi:unnamed protein product [Sphagnum jensenii]|uniref:Uncharacterized protein n=1 Tax=Sphagnum jensenii TaxID=128206 RepID=A0ABP1BE83_9BRYO